MVYSGPDWTLSDFMISWVTLVIVEVHLVKYVSLYGSVCWTTFELASYYRTVLFSRDNPRTHLSIKISGHSSKRFGIVTT